MRPYLFSLFSCFILLSCTKDDQSADPPAPGETLYFPAVGSNVWDDTTVAELGWNQARLDEVYTYLDEKNTRAFIILKNGKIVAERYWRGASATSAWYWASAGKTVTAMLVGIAQKDGDLSLSDKTSDYLGTGWTSAPLTKENLITVKHQVSMSTGLDDQVEPDNFCTMPACLVYKADAGTRWAYHNAPYTLLDKVLVSATGKTFNNYFQEKITAKAGVTGLWVEEGYNNVLWSNARSMARYGLLLLNRGKWGETPVLNDDNYFSQMINSSQPINPSYGYLTWLNGKTSHMLPSTQYQFNGMLFPNAPSDLYAALGKNDQKIYVVPSQNLVVIRMGESAGNVQLAVSSFDNELWGKLKQVIGY